MTFGSGPFGAGAFGASSAFDQTATAASIADAAALGTPNAAGPLLVSSCPSAAVVSQASAVGPIAPDAVASDEAFGVPSIGSMALIEPVSLGSAEAFGSPVVGFILYPDSLASAEAFGAPVLVPGGVTAWPQSIAAAAQVSQVIAAGPVIPVSLTSSEAFGDVGVTNYGMFRVRQGTRGDIRGGARVNLAGAVLDMRPCGDAFDDDILDPSLWTDESVGGFVNERAGRLEFDTGLTANASACVRSVGASAYLDVEVLCQNRQVILPIDAVVRVASLGFYVSPAEELRVDLETDRTSQLVARVIATRSSAVVFEQTQGVGRLVDAAVLQLLRVGPRVVVSVNSTRVADVLWTTTASQFQFVVSNAAASAGTRVRTAFSAFQRRPVILFADAPAEANTFISNGILDVNVPAVSKPGLVDVTAYGCASTETVVQGFEYLVENRFVIGRSATAQLVVLNDPALREN